jgi:hypothetical protein
MVILPADETTPQTKIDGNTPRWEAYRLLRKALGTQREVSAILGITAEAMSQRESGKRSIKDESILALVWLKRQRKAEAQSRVRTV